MLTGEAALVATVVCSGVVGLLVGSFLNVVVYRLPRGMSIVRPRSHCPSCTAQLGGLENVPVLSWLALRGRCRHCLAPISARYPLVELATAASFAGLAAALGSLAPLPSFAVVVACAVGAAIIDADGFAVPAALAVGAVAGAVSLAAVAAAVGSPGRVGWAVLGAVLSGLAALVADRSSTSGRWRYAAIVMTLGWCAGWAWQEGGLLVAGWVVVATAATAVGGTRRVPLAVLAAGAFVMMLVGASLARP